jgi:hypothetical protein
VDRPDTTPCTVELFADRKFVPRDGSPPQDYEYAPPEDCVGPWAKVVLESDFYTDPEAALYDKTAQLFLGGVTLYYGTTMGPGRYCENYPEWTVPTAALPTCPEEPPLVPRWHEENDLTEYSALFAEPQSGKVHLDNDAYLTSYYTPADTILDAGQYWSARLVFYPLADGQAAPLVADEVRSLDPDTDEGEVIWSTSQSLSYTFTDLPRNLERVYLDVQREGQRSDEFYNGSGNDHRTRTREFEVKIDGMPAGVAPAYPYIYTYGTVAGYDDRNWAPVPAVSAFNFIGYRVDLTPFAGYLSNGDPHTVSINIYGLRNSPTQRTCVFGDVTTRFGIPATGCGYGPDGNGYVLTGGAFWYVMGNLVLYTDHGSVMTSGGVTVNTLTAEPTVTVTGSGQSARRVLNHDHVISGYVNTSHGQVVTTLDQKISLDTNIDGQSTSNSRANQLTEYVAKTTVAEGDDVSSTTVNLQYVNRHGSFLADGQSAMGWTYSAQTEENGEAGYWVNISDFYKTVPRSNAAQQQYVAFDSAGRCYDRTLVADISQRKPAITGVFDGGACASLVGLSAAPASQAAGGVVELTAALDGVSAVGSVEFFDGGVSLGSVAVVDGAAVLTTSALAEGVHSLSARYVAGADAAGVFRSSDLAEPVEYSVSGALASVEVGSKCIAGKAYLTVTAVNESDVPLSVEVTSPYGVKVFPSIAPGKSGFHSFTTRVAAYAGAPVGVFAQSLSDSRSGTYTAAATASC